MNTLVIYATKFGNTEQVARAIARGAAGAGTTVRVVSVEDAAEALRERPTLLLVGGPTQRRGMSPELRGFMESLAGGSLRDLPVAAYDTRYQGSTLIMGSAANEVRKRLQSLGGRLVAPAESFFIGRGGPMEQQTLLAGELDRAAAWGSRLAAAQSALAA